MSSSPPAMWTKNIPLFFVIVIKNNFIHYLFSTLYQSTVFMLLILFLNVYWQAEMLSDFYQSSENAMNIKKNTLDNKINNINIAYFL